MVHDQWWTLYLLLIELDYFWRKSVSDILLFKVWMFDRAREDLKTLRDLTGKPHKKLARQIEDAYWTAALLTLEKPSRAKIYQQIPPQTKKPSVSQCNLAATPGDSPRSASGDAREERKVYLCMENLDDYYEDYDEWEGMEVLIERLRGNIYVVKISSNQFSPLLWMTNTVYRTFST